MKLVAKFLTLFVAISHIGILILEMFYWNHPTGHRIFAMTPEVAAASEVLAMNQGLYNGFLAAGLFWGLLNDRFDLRNLCKNHDRQLEPQKTRTFCCETSQ